MNAIAPLPPTPPAPRRSILQTVAGRYNMEPDAFERTLRATVVPQNCSKEQFAACMVVANEYRLNPLTKEIYFFPARGGGVVPMVGVDGWARIINEHPAFDGMDFETAFDDKGKPFSVTCRMFRKDRVRPVAVTEFHSECARPTDPWKTAPARMLRHKAMIQSARYAFGFSGIYDEDDAEKIRADNARDVTPRAEPEPVKAALTPPRPPSPPKPPSAPKVVEAEVVEQQADDIDWEREYEAYDSALSACEAEESFNEAKGQMGSVFVDAPELIQARVHELEDGVLASIRRQA